MEKLKCLGAMDFLKGLGYLAENLGRSTAKRPRTGHF
jgi:hypothetical protein